MPLRRTTLLGLAASLVGCSPLGLLDATVPAGGLGAERDIAYGPGPRQRLDLWQPPGAPRATLVWFYGGNWRSGDRASYRFVAEALAPAGVRVAIPDYRLYPEGAYPIFLEDAAAATRFVLRRVPPPVFLAGHSAGAYIALMLALDPRWLGPDRARIAGAISLAGPTDFLPIRGTDVREVFAAAAADLRETQPITYADASAPPLLLATGTDDTTVLPRNSKRLAARIESAGGSATLRRYPGLGHVGVLTALTPLFRHRAPVRDDMLEFLRSHWT